ncbi:hypothetical protein SSYIS1_29510 [Serratia symbiotica]|uniref:Uncharacterized protein n=1 Tax=Serratia symbiotica TaxID=138074 RepID=A0A455VV45_9GAMM|nr:hypothetical protein SSYIS1_24690 [Serratia symbiotica]BBI92971.1 hypothetical protein SSYIS1_29510 [Serratia symbiotica]
MVIINIIKMIYLLMIESSSLITNQYHNLRDLLRKKETNNHNKLYLTLS